jgi:hypothetical protein
MTIKRIKEFLPPNDLQQINQQLTSTSGWTFHKLFWRYYLFNGLNPYNQHDPKTWYGNQPGALEQLTPVWKRLFDNVFEIAGPTFQLMRCSITGQTQNQTPTIHIDVDQDMTGTYRSYLLYLNSEWLPEWGGPTEIEVEDNIWHHELPEPGKLIDFDSKLWHIGRPPVEPNILRLTMVLHGRIY